MKVILLEDIKSLGAAGTQVEVAEGYARNYLIPGRLALGATPGNLKVYDNEAKARSKKKDKEKQEAVALAAVLGGLQVHIARNAGDDDKLFGSVTNADVAEGLLALGHKVDKRTVRLEEPLKSLGMFDVLVHLHPEVNATVKVWVVKQQLAQ